MTRELEMRLLAALCVGAGLGVLIAGRLKTRLEQWRTNPAATQARTVQNLERAASGRAPIVFGFICVAITILVELIVSLAGGAR